MPGDCRDRPPEQRCERYRRDGRRCSNTTTNADGWCHDPECDGFRRAGTGSAPADIAGPPGGTDRQVAESPATGLSPAKSVHVTTAALDSFRYHHGGSIDSAERELLDMLGDFLDRSAMRASGDYVLLSRDGYQLVVDSEVRAVTGYRTVHRERTWAQYRAGVRSRFRGGRTAGREGAGLLRQPPERVPLVYDPTSVRITRQALKGFARRHGLRELPEEEQEAQLRRALDRLRSEEDGAVRNDARVEATRDDARFVLSPEQDRLVDVLRPRRPAPGSAGED